MANTKEQLGDDHQFSLPPGKKEKRHISENLRVLAIDDNVVCLKVLAFELEKCGYQVTATTKASEAIEMLRKNKDDYDIVITDVMRSDMDGFELLEIIGLELDIPVIMTSADSDMKTVEKGVKHGARDYLVKPVRIEILRNIWQHVIRKTVNNYKSDCMEAKTLRNSLPRKRHQRDEDESGQSSEESLAQKKSRVVWKPWLHEKFIAAVQQLGVDKAVPKKILELMNEPQLTRESVASHLQKYRNSLKKLKESMTQGKKSHIDTNGMPHFCNTIIHGPVESHGLHTINHSNGYSEYGMSSFTGRNYPFLPLNYHNIVLRQNGVPSKEVNQTWKDMASPGLKNVAAGTILTADPELSAMEYQTIQQQRNMVDHDYGQISSQLGGIDAVPKHPNSFTASVVGNSSCNLPILSRPYPNSPGAFSPGAPHQMYVDAVTQTNPFSELHSVAGQASNSLPAMNLAQCNRGQQDRRSLVSLCGKGGSDFQRVSTAFPVDMQGEVNDLSGDDQIGLAQSFLGSSERQNNGHHHVIEDYPDDDLSAIVKEFASDAAPRI